MNREALIELAGKHDRIEVGESIYSLDPPETLFGFTSHAHMIPPWKPEKTCILGYGNGTVAKLMRKVWGDKLSITGVDLDGTTKRHLEDRIVVGDAMTYLMFCTDGDLVRKYDYVCVDLYDDEVQIPDYVFSDEFAGRLKIMTKKMLCLNLTDDVFPSRCQTFYDYGFKFERFVPLDRQRIVWWSA